MQKLKTERFIEGITKIKHSFMEIVTRRMRVFQKILNKLCKLAMCKLNVFKETAHNMKASSNSCAVVHHYCV